MAARSLTERGYILHSRVVQLRRFYSIGLMGFGLLAGCASQDGATSSAVPPPTGTSNEFVLASGFAPERRTGKATGSVELSECKLWIGEKADFTMKLESEPMGELRIRTLSANGAKPVVRFPKGTFCAKEAENVPPTISRGAWSKDTYEIFIGVPESGQSADYTLEIFEEK